MTSLLLLLAALLPAARASDPPHDDANGVNCTDCHDGHGGMGMALNIDADNANVCQSCHVSGGLASALALPDSAQALPGTSGTSHRFDSGPAGHAEADAGNASTGVVDVTGAYTGRDARTWTLTITASGDVGAATFSWTASDGSSGADTTAASVALSDGVSATFADGSASPSFVAGDAWTLYARPDIAAPDTGTTAGAALAAAMVDGKVVCSTCHDQHSQAASPADPAAPAYGGTGTGEGRHFQRVDNDADQMCLSCHAPRDVASAADGSHPVGVPIPASADYTTPTGLDLLGGNVSCSTCHVVHFASASDGNLLAEGTATLCAECHALGAAGASHLDGSAGATWPGGQYGSDYPARTDTGGCPNCHAPHGWPDDDAVADYPGLLVEQYDQADDGTDPADDEDLCRTCHDGAPASTDIWTQITQGTNGTAIHHHPVRDAEQSAGRSVECRDCHNPHQATSAEPWAGAGGVALDGTSIAVGDPVEEYEVCLKCHGDDYNAARARATNKRTEFAADASAYHPVQQAGRNTSEAMQRSLLGGLTTSSTLLCSDCHADDATGGTQGPVSNYAGGEPLGPHGSAEAYLLRAAYPADSSSQSYSSAAYALCFLCHSETALFDSTQTNFDDHRKHVQNAGTPCAVCHYNVHGNANDTANTWYRIDGTLYKNGPPTGYKTRLIAFMPGAVTGTTYSVPTWGYDTSSHRGYCWLRCHMRGHNPKSYTPDAGLAQDAWTY